MNGATLLSITAQRPRKVITNDELPADLGTSDEWIRTRSGIESRVIASEDETLLDLVYGAAAKAIAESGVDQSHIDLTIVATTTNPQPTPAIGPQLTHRLGLTSGAIDMQGACAGYCYGIGMGADAVRSGNARNVLVIGAERLSDRMNWSDRNTCYLFGDGAGASVIGPTSLENNAIWNPVWGSDGSLGDAISVPLGEEFLQMDGQTVFRWAITNIVEVSKAACERAGVSIEDIDVFVPHQANLRIVESIARSLKLRPDAVIADDVRYSGNTSAASIPLAITRLKEEGRAKPGDLALMVAFGAGMTWAGQVVRLP